MRPRTSLALAAAMTATTAAVMFGAVTAASAAPNQDRDCADFPTAAAAQAYFVSRGYSAANDPERLDSNRNGLACENLTGPAAAPRTIVQEPEQAEPVTDDPGLNVK